MKKKQGNKLTTSQKWLIVTGIFLSIYVVSLFVFPLKAYTWYPISILECGGKPIIGSTLAAGRSYRTPDNPSYTLSAFSQPEYYFCSKEEAEENGFRPANNEPSQNNN